jgi:predicted transcriptional regulator
MSRVTILLSIHPRFADQIFDGTKRIEFRKRNLPAESRRVFVYSTSPTSTILGYFDVEMTVDLPPAILWRKYSNIGGILKGAFDSYYQGHRLGRGLLIASIQRFSRAVPLPKGIRAPQSFVYLEDEVATQIARRGG